MAIYHFAAQAISRSAGRSATAAAAYRAAARVVDERTGEIHDYRRKGGVLHAQIVLPEGAGQWARDRSDLWSAVEQAEKRKDACVAREYVIALPCELTREQQIALVMGWAQQQAAETGAAYDVCVHEADAEGDNRNTHAHVMRTTRAVLANGLDTHKLAVEGPHRQRRAELVELRQSWADAANRALAEAGRPERIDHRSLQDRGITDREPGVHQGPAITNMLRKAERVAREAVAEVERLQAELAGAVAERASAAAAAAAAVAAIAAVVPQARQAPQEARQAAQLAELRKAALQADAQRNAASMLSAQLGDLRGRLVELRKSLSDAQIERAALEQQISRRSWLERVAARLGDPDAARVAELRSRAQEIAREIAAVTPLVPAADSARADAAAAARDAQNAARAVHAAERELAEAQAAAERAARIAAARDRPDDDGQAERDRG